jgi:hypothetical protein
VVGSKAHLSESCDDDLPLLVTDVHTTTATDPDVTATTPIQEKLAERGLAPGEHLLDAGYPSADNLTRALELGITMISPLTVATGRNATKDTFPQARSPSTGMPGRHLPRRSDQPPRPPRGPRPGRVPLLHP